MYTMAIWRCPKIRLPQNDKKMDGRMVDDGQS